jgi:DNA polymerase-3 subunit delta
MPELRCDQLIGRLDQGLAPMVLLAGEEPLIIEETLDQLRQRAREHGYLEREILHVETGFDWGRIAASTDNLSLFAARRLLELRLPNGKPGKEGSAVLKAYAQNPPEDTALVVIAGRLEPAQRKSAWVQAIAKAGVMSYVWPLRRHELSDWVAHRAQSRGLTIDRDAAALLAERNEGNLLALAQEVEKLALMSDGKAVGLAEARDAVADSARYAVFDLPDAVAAGDVARAQRITQRLRVEGEEPVLVLWGLSRDLRVLADLQASQATGESAAAVMKRHRVWQTRQSRLQQLAQRAPRQAWARLLARAAAADRAIKGAEPRRGWDDLIELACGAARLAGQTNQRGST